MLEAWRRAQRQVFKCLIAVAEELVPGDSERDAARMIVERVTAIGCRSWFHEPYVFFGERTAPTARLGIADYRPSQRRLARGMPVILDAAPIVDEMIVDSTYTFACGADDPALHDVLDVLAAVRALVPEAVAVAKGPNDIFRAIEQLARERGCRTCHKLTPFGPLAHRLDGIRHIKTGARIAGVDVGMLALLGGGDVLARLSGSTSPLWTARGRSGRLTGLWSVEPHLARGDVGAKFEEVLVVDGDGARWLDDESWLATRVLA